MYNYIFIYLYPGSHQEEYTQKELEVKRVGDVNELRGLMTINLTGDDYIFMVWAIHICLRWLSMYEFL